MSNQSLKTQVLPEESLITVILEGYAVDKITNQEIFFFEDGFSIKSISEDSLEWGDLGYVDVKFSLEEDEPPSSILASLELRRTFGVPKVGVTDLIELGLEDLSKVMNLPNGLTKVSIYREADLKSFLLLFS